VSEPLKGKAMFGKQFSPLSDEDFKAVVNFHRNHAREFKKYADDLEASEVSDRTIDIIKHFQQEIEWFKKWIKFLEEA
jgi:hypothetical protein